MGWVPTLEPWFPKNDFLTFLKLRASYGEVGNDQLGASRRYYYLPNTWNLNQSGYWLGTSDGSAPNTYFYGATEGNLGNQDITWERARKFDAGVESKFFRNRLSIDYDWFYEKRDNILTTLGIIPAIYGVSQSDVPPANVGVTMNKGYEVVLNWTDKVGDFIYTLGADLSYARNKIIYMAEAENPYEWMNQTGHMIGQRYGLQNDGLFNTQDRGRLFIGPGVQVYEGMIVGECAKNEDIVCNVCKKKQMTNTRAAGSDEALRLTPHTVLSLEQCMEFLSDDELLEVTPQSLRLRKTILSKELRMKQQFRKK